jgi:hypothetical protein
VACNPGLEGRSAKAATASKLRKRRLS